MKLELRFKDRDIRGPAPFVLEHGTRLVGRSRDCDWQIDADDRRVSKVHCSVQRIRDAFEVTDKSANGTRVDGRVIQEGQSALLVDGSVIEMGGCSLSARIVGEPSEAIPDPSRAVRASEEPLTISAILADVSPGGQMARGILGRKDADGQLDDMLGAKKNRPTISRNVQVGWDSPPAPSSASGGAVLPDNWFEEDDFGTKTEHVAATKASVSIARPVARPTLSDDFEDVFADDPTDDADDGDDRKSPRTMTPPPSPAPDFTRLKAAITALERTSEDCFALLDMQTGDEKPQGMQSEEKLAARLEALARNQQRFAELLETMFREATRRLEPRVIEARLDAVDNPLKRLVRPNYWKTYKAQFLQGEQPINIIEFLKNAAHGTLPDPEEAVRRATSTTAARAPHET